jgi:O-antigen/teichoic acid export membrane protein
MGVIIIRDVARRRERAGAYLSSALVMQTILGLLAYAGIQTAAALLDYPPEVRGYLAIASLSLFIDMFGTLCFEQLQAQERMVINAVIEFAHIAIRIALAAVVLFAGYGLLGVYVVTLLSGIGRAVALWVVLLRSGVRPQFPLDRSLARGLLRDGAPGAAAGLVTTAYQNLDRLVTASVIGSRAVGYLSAAFIVVFGVIELLSTTVLIAVFPLLARISGADGDMVRFRRVVERLAHFTLVVTLPIVLAVSIYADALVSLLGSAYAPTGELLRVMIWYAFFAMLSNIYMQALLAENRQHVTFFIRTIVLAFNLGLLLLLLPRLGLIGAPLVSIIGEMIVLALLVWQYARGAPPLPNLGKVLRAIAAGAAAGVVMALLHIIQPPPLAAVIGGAAGLLVYGGLILVLRGFDSDDWALIRQLVGAMPGGGRLARFLPTVAP